MTALEEFRNQKDRFFESDPQPPLSNGQKRGLKALKYFPENAALRFETEGQPAVLTVYTSEDGDGFVSLVDATSGTETYGAGRYLKREHHGGNRFHVGVHRPYNPWCAYSPELGCPTPSKQNRQQAPIRAREKEFGH